MAYSQAQIDEVLKKYPTLASAGGGSFLAGKMTDSSLANPEAELLNWGRSEVPEFASSFGLASDVQGRIQRGQTEAEALAALGTTKEAIAPLLPAVSATQQAGGFTSGPLSPQTAAGGGTDLVEIKSPYGDKQTVMVGDLPYWQKQNWQVSNYTPGLKPIKEKVKETAITSESAQAQPEIPFTEVPAPAPITGTGGTVAGAGTSTTTLTPTGQQAQGLVTEAMDASNKLLGQSAYKSEQEEKYGVTGISSTIRDLTAQLQAVKNEYAAIIPATELESMGLGITTELLGRKQQELLRQNSLKALNISTMLAAAQGNLATAQELADKATEAEFAPQRERLAIAQANLELLLKSPLLKAEEEEKLLKTQQVMNAQAQAQKTAEENAKEIKEIGINAAQNGADAATLKKIFEAKTTYDAIVASINFVNPPTTTTTKTEVVEAGGRKLLINSVTGATIRDLGSTEASTSIPEVTKKAEQFNFLTSTADRALSLAGASGRSALRRGIEEKYYGATDYTELVAETNTLRTNLLTLLADPDVKKFFGPQMSNADVQFMMSGGTSLNPELQKPEALKAEITRIKETIAKAKAALSAGTMNTEQTTGKLISPDGTQQVNISDLTPAQIQEAKNAGWKQQ